MRKSIISLPILAFIITFSFISFFSKKIGTHWQKYPKRKLNPNNNKDTIISHKPNIFINQRFGPAKSIFYNPSIGEPCECEVGDEYQDNQGIHRSLKCQCEENFESDFPYFSNIECFFTDSKNCNCAVVEISENYINFDCLYNLTYNSTFNCSGYYFFKDECDPILTNNEQNSEYIYHILDQIEKGYFEDIFSSAVEENETFIQKENNITYQISTVSSQYSTNLSTVGLEECESILKKVYSLDKNETLVLLKLEHEVENSKIPIIEYQLFSKNGTKLDLSYCNKTEQIVSIPVKINEDEEFIHNPNSDFYQDKCYTYTTEYDTDLSSYDRKNNYNEKYLALCEKGCTYKGYNKTNKRVNCECKTKFSFPNPELLLEEIDVKELLNRFIDFKKLFFNVYVITCYKQLFSSKGLKKNSANSINMAIFVAGGLFTILFCVLGYKSFRKKINKIISEKKLKINQKQDNSANLDLKSITTIEQDFKVDKLSKNDSNDNKNSNSNLHRNLYDDYNDYEITDFEYDEAKEKDLSYYEIYRSMIKTSHIFISTFLVNDDYNSTEIKICLFIFWLSIGFATNALFFNDSTLHKIYEDKGDYDYIYQLPFTIYSAIISFFMTKLLTLFGIVENSIAKKVKDINSSKNPERELDKIGEIKDCLCSIKCKFIIFFSLIIFLFLLFWYYSSCFCAVFPNTQIPLIKDTARSYAQSLIVPLFLVLIPTTMKYCSLPKKGKVKYKEKDKKKEEDNKCCKCLYGFADKINELIFSFF